MAGRPGMGVQDEELSRIALNAITEDLRRLKESGEAFTNDPECVFRLAQAVRELHRGLL